MKRILLPSILTLTLVSMVGCSTPSGVKTAETTGSDLARLEKQFEESRSQIAAVMSALNDLTKEGADTKRELGRFTKAVESLQKSTDADSKDEARVEESFNAYLENWSSELAGMNNEELKQQSAARQSEVSAAFQAVKTAFNEAKTSYDPFLKQLNDLVSYLSTDLSPAGVSAAGNTITELKTQGANVQRAIQNAMEKVQALRTTMGR